MGAKTHLEHLSEQLDDAYRRYCYVRDEYEKEKRRVSQEPDRDGAETPSNIIGFDKRLSVSARS